MISKNLFRLTQNFVLHGAPRVQNFSKVANLSKNYNFKWAQAFSLMAFTGLTIMYQNKTKNSLDDFYEQSIPSGDVQEG